MAVEPGGNTVRIVVAIAIAAAMQIMPAAAENEHGIAGEEIDTSFEASQTRLTGDGYSEIKMVNNDPYRLAAYDREGSEVLLTINPQSGEIDTIDYVHPMDQ